MVLAAIPVSHRGIALKQHISGKARSIIKDTIQELNPSFGYLADVLKTYFGEASTQMELIQSLHQKHGPVPATSDMSRSIREIFDVTKGHITLLEAAASLHQQYMTGSLKANPITGSYLTVIGRMLPREDRKRLTNISGYHLMELHERFQEIYDIFKSTQQFALTEISRYGQSTESCGQTQQLGQPPYITMNPGTTNRLPMFPHPPPTPPLFLPPPTICSHNNNIQCFRCSPNMSTINRRASPCHDWNSNKLTFPYPPPLISG